MRTEKKYFIFAVCCCLLFAAMVLCSNAEAAGATMEITARVPLIAYDIAATDITSISANITWMTNGLTNSTVWYGWNTSYDGFKTNSTMVTDHAIILEGLSAGQEYHYNVVSSDSAGNTYTSADFTFSTSTGFISPTPGGKSFSGGSGGGGSVSAFGNIVGMPALSLLTSSPALTIASGSLIPLTADNLVSQQVVVVSGDRSASLSIETATRILDKDGKPLGSIGLTRVATKNVPAVPKGSLFVFSGYAYQIQPSGATFSPPLALKITPTPEEWKQISGQEISIQYYNPVTGLWDPLSTTSDPEMHTATTMIYHASDYGLFIRPASSAFSPVTKSTMTTISETFPVPRAPLWPGRINVAQLTVLIATVLVACIIGLYFYRARNGHKSK